MTRKIAIPVGCSGTHTLKIAGEVEAPEPGPWNGEWFIADIEIALFQFAWESRNKII